MGKRRRDQNVAGAVGRFWQRENDASSVGLTAVIAAEELPTAQPSRFQHLLKVDGGHDVQGFVTEKINDTIGGFMDFAQRGFRIFVDGMSSTGCLGEAWLCVRRSAMSDIPASIFCWT